MAELDGDEPAAPAFDDWMLLLAAASGGQHLDLPPRSPLGKAARTYIRGIITDTEFGTMLWRNTSMWNQLLSGVAAHRAASDWMATSFRQHCGARARCSHQRSSTTYLSTIGAPQLSSRVWEMREDDTGSDFGSTGPLRSERAEHLMQDMGWNPSTQVESVSPARDPWAHRTTTGLAWIGWFGNALRNDDIVDAAIQSRLHDGRPLVGRFEGWANYMILEPSYITRAHPGHRPGGRCHGDPRTFHPEPQRMGDPTQHQHRDELIAPSGLAGNRADRQTHEPPQPLRSSRAIVDPALAQTPQSRCGR